MTSSQTLEILRSVAIDLASELDLHYSPAAIANMTSVVNNLREAFELLQRETGEEVPALHQIITLHDKLAAADEVEGDHDKGPMELFHDAFAGLPPFTDAQFHVIKDVLMFFATCVDETYPSESLKEAAPMVAIIEQARRMLYCMGYAAPFAVERLLTRHHRMLLDEILVEEWRRIERQQRH
jgi:hypothetical protein